MSRATKQRKDAPSSTTHRPLTPRQQRFVELYLISLNATASYREAYGCSSVVANRNGPRLLVNAGVATAISAAQVKRGERAQVTADHVFAELWSLYTADTNELVEYRRACCRHCYGDGHDYQLTQREMDKREEEWAKRKGGKPTDIFDPLGGVGFDARKAPNPECPECFGDGQGYVHFKDSRYLSPAARRLYAGVKVGKDGTEMKILDRFAALKLVGEHLGMFKPQGEPPETEESRAKRIRAELDAMDATIEASVEDAA